MRAALLGYRASNFTGRRIAHFWFPRGEHCHSSIVVWEREPAFTHGWLLESIWPDGIPAQPRRLRIEDLDADWLVPNDGVLGPEWMSEWLAVGVPRGWAWAQTQGGKGYAGPQLVRTFVLRRDVTADELQREREGREVWWCSEFDFVFAMKTGWPLFGETVGFEVPPDMIRRSPLARRLTALEKRSFVNP